jgi:ribosomal protein L37AE/L43A
MSNAYRLTTTCKHCGRTIVQRGQYGQWHHVKPLSRSDSHAATPPKGR